MLIEAGYKMKIEKKHPKKYLTQSKEQGKISLPGDLL